MNFFRTAVLFTRKAQAALKKPETPVKEELLGEILSMMEKPKSPKKTGRTKRNSSRKSFDSIEGAIGASTAGGSSLAGSSTGILEKKKSPNTPAGSGSKKSPNKDQSFEAIPDSFRLYRAQDNRDLSDSDESHVSFTESTCSSCSGFSDSGSDFG